jgi:2-polyprenyl-6-methoxyphenol hydroxylase-like FAD-dependent oxidoreductase
LHEVRSPQSFDLVWGKVPFPSFVSAGATVPAYIGNSHAVVCFPSYDGRLEFGWAIEKGSFGDLRKRGIDEWIDQMTEFGSPDLGAHLRAHRADVTHPLVLDVICDRLTKWGAPGLILLGDACHPMSPAGGARASTSRFATLWSRPITCVWRINDFGRKSANRQRQAWPWRSRCVAME